MPYDFSAGIIRTGKSYWCGCAIHDELFHYAQSYATEIISGDQLQSMIQRITLDFVLIQLSCARQAASCPTRSSKSIPSKKRSAQDFESPSTKQAKSEPASPTTLQITTLSLTEATHSHSEEPLQDEVAESTDGANQQIIPTASSGHRCHVCSKTYAIVNTALRVLTINIALFAIHFLAKETHGVRKDYPSIGEDPDYAYLEEADAVRLAGSIGKCNVQFGLAIKLEYQDTWTWVGPSKKSTASTTITDALQRTQSEEFSG
ncbi:NAD(P)H-quinone oxidoreductase subunit S [Lasiodiplodia theobromae]|uniref:NAD(P)H-quinone oxidoreductase subunit S n=1 Tax=Lasiodiplodia theobromae TaxID=45133 RepID=UPI0015C3733C|nr:NAD(P)H-quinone oxidoreductase subunit S [Lasiodiplodia theobromae]KAF4541931.1 NAD(P)H-quinone oxidoreductase subunit S [Lasiodiplodia theobromae]